MVTKPYEMASVHREAKALVFGSLGSFKGPGIRKGKPRESVGRKATGLTGTHWTCRMAAGLSKCDKSGKT